MHAKTIKVMSIIGIILFPLSFIAVVASIDTDPYASSGFGILALLYAIAYSITSLVKSTSWIKSSKKNNAMQELIKLNELKEKGVLSEEEFQQRKNKLLELM